MGRTRFVVLVLATVILVAACSTSSDGTDEVTVPTDASETTTTVAPATTAAPETTTTAAATTTTAPASTVIEVDWQPSFTVTTPPNWRQDFSAPSMFAFKAGSTWIVFSTEGPDSVDGWLEKLASNTEIVTTEPAPVELGSAPGYVVDLRLSDSHDAVCPFIGPCSRLLEGGFGWSVVEGEPNRLWLVDVDGETVVIVTEAPEGSFETWVTKVGEVLSTITWG